MQLIYGGDGLPHLDEHMILRFVQLTDMNLQNININHQNFRQEYILNLINNFEDLDDSRIEEQIIQNDPDHTEFDGTDEIFMYLLKPFIHHKMIKVLQNEANQYLLSYMKRFIMNAPIRKKKARRTMAFLIAHYGYILEVLDASYFESSSIMVLLKNNCVNLTKITLCLKKISDEDFENVFIGFNVLESLDLTWVSKKTFPESLIESLKTIANTLKSLYLRGVAKNKVHAPTSLSEVFSNATNLKLLKIWNLNLSQKTINSIGKIINLETLVLNFEHLEDFDKKLNIYEIGNLKNLVTLEVYSNFGITDSFLMNLCNNSNQIKEIKITAYHISNGYITNLNKLTELKKVCLLINYFSLKQRTIDFITDDSIKNLNCESLTYLCLATVSGISNKSVLSIFVNLPVLESLFVQNTQVNTKIVDQLKDKGKHNVFLRIQVSFEDEELNFRKYERRRNFMLEYLPFEKCFFYI